MRLYMCANWMCGCMCVVSGVYVVYVYDWCACVHAENKFAQMADMEQV